MKNADFSEEPNASIIRVTRIGELGKTLAVTSNRSTLQPRSWTRYFRPKRRFLQEPRGVTSQKTVFFITSSLDESVWAPALLNFLYLACVCDIERFCLVVSV
jgi:hypothetical protein